MRKDQHEDSKVIQITNAKALTKNRRRNVLRSSNHTTIAMNCLRCRNNNVVDIQQDIDFTSLPFLEITSPPTSIDHLTSSNVDLHLPYDMSFQYYNSHEFHDKSLCK